MKRLLLLITIIFGSFTGVYAQTLYWVGGTGSFNDPSHWSYTSGGNPAFKAPGQNTDLIFDNNSGIQPVISIIGKNYARNIQFLNSDKLFITGDGSSELNVSGNFLLNNATHFDAQSKLVFNSSSANANSVFSNVNELNCDIYFEGGNWQVAQLLTIGSVNVKGGTFELLNGYLRCNDFITTNNANIKFTNSGTTIKNKIDISSGSVVDANDLYIMANRSNPQLYKVPALFQNTAKVKTGDNTLMACGITTAMTLPTCPNLCDGVISFTFNAGCIDNPYSISYPGWPTACTAVPSPTTLTAPAVFSVTNLCKCGSTYQFAVTDGSLNIVAFYQVAMVMSDLDFTPFVITQPSCFGSCNGSINGAISGGTGPYSGTVLANSTATVNQTFTTGLAITLTNLCATAPSAALPVYTLNITDNKGCMATKTLSMNQPPQLLPNGTTFSIACFGICTGSAQVSPTGGTPNYTVNWSTPATFTLAPSGSSSQTGLCAGPISATVTDSKGCKATFATSITQPTAALSSTQTQTNVTCGGICDASASVTPAGGTPGYSYTWTPAPGGGQGTPLATALCGSNVPAPTNYSVTIQDANGCSIVKTFNISQPNPLIVNPTFTNATCNGTCNGSANSNASGGTAPYTYTWTGPAFSSNAPNITGLCPGIYTLAVKDASNCTTSATVSITQPPPIALTVSQTSITCNGFCTGSATATAIGGNGGFTYTWTAPTPSVITGQGTATVSNLCAGNYTLTVKDGSTCTTAPVTFTIAQPPPILPNVTTQSITCAGLCNGVINTNPSGGTGPYNYTLTGTSYSSVIPNSSNASFSGLCASITAGIYTLTVGDATNSCIRTVTINLLQPNTLTLTATTTSVTCFGFCNGSLAGSVNGGSAPYTFTWTTPTGTLTSPTINNQCVGPYTLDVTDANGCTTQTAVTIIQPTQITITLNPTPPSCNGGCNGSITSTVTGGTPTYTYNWTTGSTLTVINGLCTGNYSLTITDKNGCQATQSASVSAPLPIIISTTVVPESCAGPPCDGQAIASASGGTAPYTYQINTIPVTTNATGTFNGLCAGNYVITVTDSKGCTNNINVIITQPPILSAIVNTVTPSCNVCIGAATITPAGGNPTYTVNWSPNPGSGQGTNTPGGLCVGVYAYTVVDAKGCTVNGSINVPQAVSVNVTTSGTVLTCFNSCNGIANANVSGGNAPYSYTWTTTVPTQTTATATGLCAGTYTVKVLDALGCINSNTITFVNPPAISVTSTITNALCNGTCNGQISVTASGGTGPLSYTWSPVGGNSPTASGLCAGVYTLDISDANNCPKSQTFTVSEASALTSTFNAVSPSTCGGTNGSITATIAGGTPNYSYTWTPTAQTGSVATNLSAGAYTLMVKDAANCTQTLIVTLSDPTGPTVTVTSNSITCNGLCNGSATVSAIGTGALSYTWSAPISSTNTVVNGLCTGTFAVNVSDATNCLTSQTLTIAQPPTFSLNPVVTNITCASACDGSITTSAAGGMGPYTYTWTPGPVNTPSLNNICQGNYTLNGNDANNCSFSQVFAVTQPLPLTINFVKQDVLCFGVCNGSITANVSGGVGPYTYSWPAIGSFPGSVLNNIINLCSNFYTLTVTDANGCSTTSVVPIFEPIALTATLSVQDALCNSQCNGSATLIASGGTPNYSYTWSSAVSTTSIVTGLCNGNYVSTLTDANGCTVTQSFVINQPAPINVTVTPVNPTCNGTCNGSISTMVTGGTGGFTYSWIPTVPTQTTATASGLCGGNYTVIATDANGCIGQNVTTLTNPPALLANATFTNPSCNSSCNGIAVSNPANGTLPYTYTWTTVPPQFTPGVSGLCPGTYSVIVQDNKMCVDTQQIILTAPATLTINPSSTAATCSLLPCNGSLNVIALGGTPSYTYAWNAANPSPITGTAGVSLCAGIYTLSLTDSKGCSSTFFIPLSNSNGPSGATVTSTNVACNGQCNGAASVTNPVGGTPAYTIVWVAPSTTVNPITNLCAGTYTAQITDANNCVYFQSVPINEPAILNASTTVNSPLCSGNCNGTITSNPTGGNPGYTYNWSTGATTSSVTGICPGNYTLTVTDTKACATTQTFNIPATVNITASTVAVNNNCFGNCSGSLLATSVAGGLPPYSFNWSDPLGQSTQQAINLCNGNYFVIVTDAQGCFDTLRGTISSPAAITLTSSVTQPSCGLCNGVAMVGASGGSGPYTYTWSGGAGAGSLASNLCAGVYMVSITDNLGCAQNVSVSVNSSSTLTETINSTNETCLGSCNGAATVTASGGTPPITYNWISPVSTSPSVSSLCSGIYFVQMTDAAGCITNASVNISSANTLTLTPFVTQPACIINNGSITLTVSGGSPGYTYLWSPGGAVTSSVTGLGVGTYTVVVTDALGCSKTMVFPLTNVNAPVFNFSANNALCNNVCNAVASISVSSGASPFTFNWSNGTVSNGVNTSTATGLCSGMVTATVTAADGCLSVQSITITQPPPIVMSLPNLSVPKCNNQCNGSITLIPSGGVLPYTYTWNPSASTNPINNLCAGAYTSTVTDANGCSATNTYTLINPPIFVLGANTVPSSCNTTPDGAITTTVTGGVPAYTYSWTGPGTFTSNASNLNNVLSGTYSLSLTDLAGCRKDTTMIIVPTVSVQALAGNDTSFCQNGSFTLDGSLSSGGTVYQWFQLPGASAIANTLTVSVNPSTGTSTYVLVVSNSGCVSQDTMMLTSNPLPVVDAGPNYTISVLTSTMIGGSPTGPAGSTFSWVPSSSLDNGTLANPVASNTINTTYTVYVTDINGCMAWDTMHVFIFPEIFIPNGFSNNGDGKNDTWVIDNIQQFPNCVVEVYNRWGELLFTSTGYRTPWDGRYKGKELPVGTYYYIIDLHHVNFPKAYTGPLTIFR